MEQRGLIELLPRTLRYRFTPQGCRIAPCFHRIFVRPAPGTVRSRSTRTHPVLHLPPECWSAWERRSIDSGRGNAPPPEPDLQKVSFWLHM